MCYRRFITRLNREKTQYANIFAGIYVCEYVNFNLKVDLNFFLSFAAKA